MFYTMRVSIYLIDVGEFSFLQIKKPENLSLIIVYLQLPLAHIVKIIYTVTYLSECLSTHGYT